MKQLRTRLSSLDVTDYDALRFFRRVVVSSNGTCLRWIGRSKVVKGFRYPMFDLRGVRPARSVAWILAGKGDPPVAGLELACGDSLCVNAEHMRPAKKNPPH